MNESIELLLCSPTFPKYINFFTQLAVNYHSQHLMAIVPISVAIYSNPGIKHWSLLAEGLTPDSKCMIHLLGARYRYFLNIRTRSDARQSRSLERIVYLTQVDAGKLPTILAVAHQTQIRNDVDDYSCQDFVIELMEKLEEEGVIPVSEEYIRGKTCVKRLRQKWE